MRRDELTTAVAEVTYLRGLISVPLGGLFLLTGLGNLGWRPLASPWVFGPCLLLLLFAAWRIQTYYNDTYGRVRSSRRTQIAYGCASGAVGAALIGGSYADFKIDLPVSIFAMSFGLAMLVSFQLYIGLKQHQLIVWGALFALGLAPVWGSFDDRASVAWLPIGIATITAGLLDHRYLLQRSLVRERESAAA
jgi:hypothetical protein